MTEKKTVGFQAIEIAEGLLSTQLALIADDPSGPRFSAYKSDGSELWVTSEVGGELTIIDPATRKIKTTVRFEVPGLRAEEIQPVCINLTKDGKWGFIDLGPANRVAVVDGATHKVTKYLLVGQRVWHGDFTPDRKSTRLNSSHRTIS